MVRPTCEITPAKVTYVLDLKAVSPSEELYEIQMLPHEKIH